MGSSYYPVRWKVKEVPTYPAQYKIYDSLHPHWERNDSWLFFVKKEDAQKECDRLNEKNENKT